MNNAYVVGLVVMIVSLSSACGVGQNVTGYGTDLEANFVAACTRDIRVTHGTLTSTTLASNSFCRCAYLHLRDTYHFDFAEWTEYESRLASAKPGNAPNPPDEVTKSIADCTKATPTIGPTTSVAK